MRITKTTFVRGVLPVAVAVASLMTPLATAVASEPSLTDTTTSDTSLTEPVDDTTSDTTDTTDATLDGAAESTDGDDTLLDAGEELTGVVDDTVDDGTEVTDPTTSEVERVVTGEEPEEDDGQTGEEDPTEDEGQPEEDDQTGEPANDGGDNGAEDDTSAQEQSGDEPAADDQEQADDGRYGRDARGVPRGLRSLMAATPRDWDAERGTSPGGYADGPLLGPRAQVQRASDPTSPEMITRVAELTYQPSAGSRSTEPIMNILRSTGALPDTTARIMAPFPIAGYANYGDDWNAPRHGGRQHRGVDVFAARGTPIIASMDGVVTGLRHDQGLGGNWLRVEAPDGTYLYYAHLEAFGPGIEEGVSVVRGQELGTVGTSGNAQGTPPHLHLQIHPGGGAPVPPLPYLDRWLDQAYQAAQSYLTSTGGVPAPEVAPPASAEMATAFGPEGSVPAPAGSSDVQTGQSYPLERASTSTTGGPATIALVVLGLIAWLMLRRPRRRSEEESDGFLEVGHAPPPPGLPLRLDVTEIVGLAEENDSQDRELVGANTP